MVEKDKCSCGYCKYFQIDGMFGLWCDKGLNWEEAEYCEYFERNMRGMTEKEMIDEWNYLLKKNKKLQFELKECNDNRQFSRRELKKENEQLNNENKELKEILKHTYEVHECETCKHNQYFNWLDPATMTREYDSKCSKGLHYGEEVHGCEEYELDLEMFKKRVKG